jgi:hypothetical protein
MRVQEGPFIWKGEIEGQQNAAARQRCELVCGVSFLLFLPRSRNNNLALQSVHFQG